jgi:chromosome segregation ATPase
MNNSFNQQAATEIAAELAQIVSRQDELAEQVERLLAEQREYTATLTNIVKRLVAVADSLAKQEQPASPFAGGPLSVFMSPFFPTTARTCR